MCLFFFFLNNRINSSVGDCRNIGLFGGIQNQHRNGGFPDWSVVVGNSKELLTGNCWPTSRAAFVPLLLSGSLVPGHVFPRSSRLLVLHGPTPSNSSWWLYLLVITPKVVRSGDEGFIFTPTIGKWKVAFHSECVAWAFGNVSPLALQNLSYLGGFQGSHFQESRL